MKGRLYVFDETTINIENDKDNDNHHEPTAHHIEDSHVFDITKSNQLHKIDNHQNNYENSKDHSHLKFPEISKIDHNLTIKQHENSSHRLHKNDHKHHKKNKAINLADPNLDLDQYISENLTEYRIANIIEPGNGFGEVALLNNCTRLF